MPRKTAGRIVPKKDANGGKLGQFTTEVFKTKQKAYLRGFMRGIRKGISAVSWSVFSIGLVIGAALMALFKSV